MLSFSFFPTSAARPKTRRAKAWGEGLSIQRALAAERQRAVEGFRADVMSGAYPAAAHMVAMKDGERERLAEALDKRYRV
jgi:3-methyl-2-oxobutanoate hydroxymethyltransferase